MDRWMVLRRQMHWRASRPAQPPVPQSTVEVPEDVPGDERAWIRNALWMLAGYLLLRLLERSLRAARPGQTRGALRV